MPSEMPSLRTQADGRDGAAELVVHLAGIELRIRHYVWIELQVILGQREIPVAAVAGRIHGYGHVEYGKTALTGGRPRRRAVAHRHVRETECRTAHLAPRSHAHIAHGRRSAPGD